jgi:hypothetical protein
VSGVADIAQARDAMEFLVAHLLRDGDRATLQIATDARIGNRKYRYGSRDSDNLRWNRRRLSKR